MRGCLKIEGKCLNSSSKIIHVIIIPKVSHHKFNDKEEQELIKENGILRWLEKVIFLMSNKMHINPELSTSFVY